MMRHAPPDRIVTVQSEDAVGQSTIPVLDLSEFGRNVADDRRFAARVGEALRDLGFFSVVNHGVDQTLIDRAYAAVERFFLLDEEVKLRYEDPQSRGQRGFTRFGREHAKDHPAPDLKEFWHVGREHAPGDPGYGVYPPNLWPAEVPEFRPLLTELYRQLDACAARLLEATALYLGEPRTLLSDMSAGANTILHYPPIPPDAPVNAVRAAAHEDINLITLLCEATSGGLELLTRSGEWIPVRAEPGQIVVDAGDMLQNLTNGLLRSTTHRVSNPDDSRERRFSMPFFVHPRAEVDLTPLPSTVAATGGVVRYPGITAGDYLLQRLREIGLA
jgi:isopenicillin N synthase-like dioxygenase